ncbi:electron transfer flavoprotein subunit beta/FixA family protein [Phytoactinopolyspora halophila]|uniref:electron transfer flavoprotein subunit beta/FixA family protein n=1 Tax=Phytoactinopolyspora halophila TaxID=1981511 RepID=UPI001B8D406B|nr:hypothetical protein [Phytoactinopolyspora halophila]
MKRVRASGGTPQLSADGGGVDTRNLAFTVGPHEECAVEEAIRIAGDAGGRVTVLTAGPPEADEQLRYAISMGADHGVLVDTGDTELDPQATAAALADAIRTLEADGATFDLIMFGNESPDAGHYQVGIRVACALSRAMVGGVKGIDIDQADGRARFRREVPAGVEVYEAALPAAVGVKEGLNLPRYPSMRGRLRARKAEVRGIQPEVAPGTLRRIRLRHPEEAGTQTVVLGHGADAAPAVVDLLEELEVV